MGKAMAKAVGILAIVIGVWVGLTVYLEGVDHAFGGAFGFFAAKPAGAEAEGEADRRPVTDRAAHAFQRAWNKSETRVDDALDEPAADDDEASDDDASNAIRSLRIFVAPRSRVARAGGEYLHRVALTDLLGKQSARVLGS